MLAPKRQMSEVLEVEDQEELLLVPEDIWRAGQSIVTGKPFPELLVQPPWAVVQCRQCTIARKCDHLHQGTIK